MPAAEWWLEAAAIRIARWPIYRNSRMICRASRCSKMLVLLQGDLQLATG
jgi:hypothetical protein